MVTNQDARKMALALPEVEEKSHFEKPDFRVRKKIFAVLHEDKRRVVIKLGKLDQSIYIQIDPEWIAPVDGGWGRQGWTYVNLKKVGKKLLQEVLLIAWKTVAPPTLCRKYFPPDGKMD